MDSITKHFSYGVGYKAIWPAKNQKFQVFFSNVTLRMTAHVEYIMRTQISLKSVFRNYAIYKTNKQIMFKLASPRVCI